MKLNDAHREQIVKMFDDGKTYKDIRGFFWDTYKIKTNDVMLSKIKKLGLRGILKIKDNGEPKRKYVRRKGPRQNPEIEKLAATFILDTEFEGHIKAAFAVLKKEFLSRAEAVITAL